jgi:hypothetical protein
MNASSPSSAHSGGRPPKFHEPSRPITVTLPEATLQSLSLIDPDRGRAIVKLTKHAVLSEGQPGKAVELVEFSEGIGLLVVASSAALRGISFLQLVEIAPSRFLVAIDPGHDFAAFELALTDALEEVPLDEMWDREVIEQLLMHMRSLRKASCVGLAGIVMVQLDSGAPRRRTRPHR